MNMMVKLDFSVAVKLNLLTLERDRQDSQYKLWTIITAVTATVFAGIGIAFQYLKALDAARTSNYLFGASLAIAIATNIVYHGFIVRHRHKDYDSLMNIATLKSTGASQQNMGTAPPQSTTV